MLFFYAIAAAVVLDVASTLYAIAIGARELNPFMRTLFGVVGPLPAMLTTHGLVLAIIFYEVPYTPGWILAAVALAWWVAVIWNIVQIWRQRRGS
jgi:hypothetical protein